MMRLLLALLMLFPAPCYGQYLFALSGEEAEPETQSGGYFTEFVADNGSLNFTPPDVGSGDWSKSGAPDAASLNTSTGALTGTMTVEGTYDIVLTRVSGHVVRVRLLIYTSAVTIDSAWLASGANQVSALGETAYVLKTGYCLYTLDDDVVADGTAFYVADRDIGLDGAGFSVTYNNGELAGADAINEEIEAPHGVCLYLDFWNTETTISSPVECDHFTLTNITIINENSCPLAHAIAGRRGYDSAFENVTVETTGQDTGTIFFYFNAGIVAVENCKLTTDIEADSFDRHAAPANLRVGQVLLSERNYIHGGNSGIVCGSDSFIRENLIANESSVTNGYGVFTYRGDNIEITDNVLLTLNGRGILINGDTDAGQVTEGCEVLRNVVLHWELPNVEFESVLNPPAFRIRYSTGGNEVADNTTLGIGGSSYTAASSLYLTNYHDEHYANDIHDNDCMVILIGTPSQHKYAHSIAMEGQGFYLYDPALDTIYDNTFATNHVHIGIDGFDGMGRQDVPLDGNAYNHITGNAAITAFSVAIDAKVAEIDFSGSVQTLVDAHVTAAKASISSAITDVGLQATRAFWSVQYSGGHDGFVEHADITNSTFGSGVDPETFEYLSDYAGGVKARSGDTHTIQLLDGVTPIASEEVVVTTAEGDSETYTTSGSGNVEIAFWDFGIEKGNGAMDPITVIPRDDFTLTVAGYDPEVVTLGSIPATVEFTPE